ncbi:hypothetical protein BASA82_000446 [Batrachochytrium salamandrivorans]|nr:hypothetical protein BASA81_003439 [Batrachochytrium salamandrivorans]KAH9262488.1 hypothetical protein BASA82_000446 [Batrachochytrium salamandrivorans]
MIGLIASLEGSYGAESGNPRRVLFFLVLLVPLVALSIALGVLVLAGRGDAWLVNCESSTAMQDLFNATTSDILIECGTSYVVFGFLELCGGGGVGLIIFFIVYFSLRKLKLEAAENEAKLADMETLIGA